MNLQVQETNHPMGAAPGIEHDEIGTLPAGSGRVAVTCIDYCPIQVSIQEIADVEDFIGQHRPEWSQVRWINVDGLSEASWLIR